MASTVLLTGGGGYVGAVLVPKLLAAGHRVRVLDLYIYGREALAGSRGHPRLEEVQGDLRHPHVVQQAVAGCDAVIHLACISNDPSFDLDPRLGRSINYDAFPHLVELAKEAGVKRFVYASTSSVYGVKQELEVTEDLALEPLTDYSRYKAMCEELLAKTRGPGFATLVLRPATVCGYSPRMRLDLTVNILTAQAYHHGRITVFGGDQRRPNIHIEDMTDAYVASLAWPAGRIDGRTYNVGYENHTVLELAEMVRDVVGEATGREVTIERTTTNDHRSYRISSDRIRRELGFSPRRTIADAIRDVARAFDEGKLPGAMQEARYYNIRQMQALRLR